MCAQCGLVVAETIDTEPEWRVFDEREKRRVRAAPYVIKTDMAAKTAGAPRPLEDFLRCSRADESRVKKVAWRLKETVKLGRRPSVEDYVKTLAARVNLPAPVVKAAVDILERNRRVLSGKKPVGLGGSLAGVV